MEHAKSGTFLVQHKIRQKTSFISLIKNNFQLKVLIHAAFFCATNVKTICTYCTQPCHTLRFSRNLRGTQAANDNLLTW